MTSTNNYDDGLTSAACTPPTWTWKPPLIADTPHQTVAATWSPLEMDFHQLKLKSAATRHAPLIIITVPF
jgi:hypothetical protein